MIYVKTERNKSQCFLFHKRPSSFVFTLTITALKVTQLTSSSLHLFLLASEKSEDVYNQEIIEILFLKNFGLRKH